MYVLDFLLFCVDCCLECCMLFCVMCFIILYCICTVLYCIVLSCIVAHFHRVKTFSDNDDDDDNLDSSFWVTKSNQLKLSQKYLCPESRVLERLIFPQLFKKFPHFTKPDGVLPFHKNTVLVPILSQINQVWISTHFLKIRWNILVSYHVRLSLQIGLFYKRV
jgi:hypothetical protein